MATSKETEAAVASTVQKGVELQTNTPITVDKLDYVPDSIVAPVAADQLEQYQKFVSGGLDRTYTAGQHLAFGASTFIATPINTVLHGLGIVERDWAANFMESLGGQVAKDYYNDYENTIGLAGEIVTSFIPGGIAMKALQAGSWLYKGAAAKGVFEALPQARHLFAANSYTRTAQAVRNQVAVARTGDKSGEIFSATSRSLAEAAKGRVDGIAGQLSGQAYVASRMADAVKQSIAFELGSFSVLHSSENLFPSDWGWIDTAFLAAGGGVLPATVERLAGRAALRRMVNKFAPIADDAASGAREMTNQILGATGVAAKPTSGMLRNREKLGVDLGNLVLHRNNWDVGYTGLNVAAAQMAKGLTTADSELAANLTQNLAAVNLQRREVVTNLATKPVNGNYAPPNYWTDAHTESFLRATGPGGDTLLSLGADGVASVPTGTKWFEQAVKKQQDSLAELDLQIETLRVAIADELPDNLDKAYANLARLETTKQQVAKRHMFVGEADGSVNLGREYVAPFHFTDDSQRIYRALEEDPVAESFTLKKVSGSFERGANEWDVSLKVEGFDVSLKARDGTKLPTNLAPYNVETAFQMLVDKVADRLKLFDEDGTPRSFILPEAPNRRQLLMALTFADRNPKFLQHLSQTKGNTTVGVTIDELRRDWLNATFKEWSEIQDAIVEGKSLEKLGFVGAGIPNNFQIRTMLNLPQPLHGDNVSFMEQMFAQVRAQGDLQLIQTTGPGAAFKSIDDFEKMLQATARGSVTDPLEAGTQEVLRERASLMGSATNRPKDGTGPNAKFLPPFLMHAREPAADGLNQRALYDKIAYTRARRLEQLGKITEASAPIVASTLQSIFRNGAFTSGAASDIESARQAVLAGTGYATTATFAHRSSPLLIAAHQISSVLDKTVIPQQQARLFNQINPISGEENFKLITRFLQPENKADRVDLSMFEAAYQRAWEVDESIQLANGRYGWRLKDTPRNRSMLQELFGRDFEEGMLMPAAHKATYEPLAVGQNTFALVNGVSEMYRSLRQDASTLNQLVDRPAIRDRGLYWTPRNLANTYRAYVTTATGEKISIITGKTPADLANNIRKAKEVVDLDKYTIVNENTMETLTTLADEAFFNPQNAQDFSIGATKAKTGSASSAVLRDGAEILHDMRRAIDDQVARIVRRTTLTAFEGEIQYAKLMNQAGPVSAAKTGTASVFEHYIDTLTGQSLRSRIRGTENAVSTAVSVSRMGEELYDNIMRELYDRAVESGQLAQFAFAPLQKTKEGISRALGLGRREYSQIDTQLGQFNPWENVEKYLQDKYRIKPPKAASAVAADLNNVTTYLTLGLFEIGHPLLNVTGLVATMPAVIRALEQRPGESALEHATRIRHFGTPVGQRGLAQYSAPKLMAAGVADMHRSGGQAAIDRAFATKHGYFDQALSEAHDAMNRLPRGDWRDNVGRVVSSLSWLSRKSESYSRGIAHMAGVRIAREAGMEGMDEIHHFAHEFANSVIGDYRAANRPMMFQGAVGQPLGLFQTYMWNYYQRMLGYIEDKNTRALAVQYAMQSSVFGVQSVPGWYQFNSLFSGDFGQTSPEEYLSQTMNPMLYDLVMHGSISAISRTALYSRGDAGLTRVPAAINPANSPVYTMANKIAKGLGEAADSLLGDGEFSYQRAMELVGTYSANRPIGRMAELLSGYAIDEQGAVLDNDTRDGLRIAASVLGLRTLTEAKQMEASYAIRQTQLAQQDKREEVRKALYTAIRSNNVDEAMLVKAFKGYITTGGKPENFADFLRDSLLIATQNKNQRQALEALRSTRVQEALRWAAVNMYQDDEATAE